MTEGREKCVFLCMDDGVLGWFDVQMCELPNRRVRAAGVAAYRARSGLKREALFQTLQHRRGHIGKTL